MDNKKYNELNELFKSTVHNCTFYLNTNKTKSFLNEVGVGKGLLYAFQLYDQLPNEEALQLFTTYIRKAQALLKDERRNLFG